MTGRYWRRPLMLRTRFTVAVAAAVTLVITAVAFLVVRWDLPGPHRLLRSFFLLCGSSPPAGSELGTT